jgi:Protein of unknown function (DUF3313)
MTFFPRLLLFVLLVTGLPSCARLNTFMKSKPAASSGSFLDYQTTPVVETSRSPWHFAAFTADQTVLGIAARRHKIFIAPVETGTLRPISKKLAGVQYTRHRPQHTQQIAETLRAEFAAALAAAPGAPWQVVSQPSRDALLLELNLLELDPTSAKGNVAKTVVKYTVGPIASTGIGFFTGGRIAIEGRLREGSTGAVILQFADREKDKATIYNVRDYMALGHSTQTLREWATQFAQFLYNRQRRVKDSFFLTPRLF